VDYAASNNFTVTRKIGFSWWGESASVQNAVANVIVYSAYSGQAIFSAGNIRPSEFQQVTEICKCSGTFFITIDISGMVPNSNYVWEFQVYDQLYSS
jgi:hypothetical protein